MATQDNNATFLAFLRQVKSKYSCDFWITREFDKILKEQKETDFFKTLFIKIKKKSSKNIIKDLENNPGKVLSAFAKGKLHKCKFCGKLCYRKNKTCCDKECNNLIANESRETNNLKKYGVKNVFQLETVKEKIKNHFITNFGVEYHTQTENYLIKTRQTNFKKYGVSHRLKRKDIRDRLSIKYLKRNTFFNNFTKEQFISKCSEIINKNYNGICVNFKQMREEIGCSQHTLRKIIKRIGFEHLIDGNKCHSQEEIQLFEKIKSNSKQLGNREILNGREIDIYIPEIKLGIEYNGAFFHNEHHRGKCYHIAKSLELYKKGVQLFHVFEFDKQDIFIGKVEYLQGLSKKIDARKCEKKTTEAKSKEIQNFINNNFTYQEKIFSEKCERFKFLTYENNIVCLIAIHKNFAIFVSDKNTCVRGGFSKLLKNENLKIIVNLNYSFGNSYLRENFEICKVIQPFKIQHYENKCYNCGLLIFRRKKYD